MTGRVVAVHLNPEHGFSKPSVATINLVEGLGVEGDAHFGATVKHRSRVKQDPDQPNLRQVHLMHAELLDELAERGYDVGPGQLGENVTTRGVDLLRLPVGTRLSLGDSAVVTITGLRNPCQQINDFRSGLLKEVVRTTDGGALERRAGVMAVVSRTGSLSGGQAIDVHLPPEPHHPLTRV